MVKRKPAYQSDAILFIIIFEYLFIKVYYTTSFI